MTAPREGLTASALAGAAHVLDNQAVATIEYTKMPEEEVEVSQGLRASLAGLHDTAGGACARTRMRRAEPPCLSSSGRRRCRGRWLSSWASTGRPPDETRCDEPGEATAVVHVPLAGRLPPAVRPSLARCLPISLAPPPPLPALWAPPPRLSQLFTQQRRQHLTNGGGTGRRRPRGVLSRAQAVAAQAPASSLSRNRSSSLLKRCGASR